MRNFIKPRVVVSECIEFQNCRWNSIMISSDFVKNLKKYVDFLPICPEVEIGLGVPRDPIRIILQNESLRLVQPATNRDVTENMNQFSKNFLDSLKEIDGFILKFRSPSCGIKESKIYAKKEKSMAISKGPGFFGRAVLEHFPYLPIETEGRLRNFEIRENFLTKLYAFSSFRKLKDSNSFNELLNFHTQNKFLLMSYNQSELKKLGNIVANFKGKSFNDVIKDYEVHFRNTFAKNPRPSSCNNILQHSLGYFSKKISHEEKIFFLNTLQDYNDGRLPISVPLNLMKSFINRFNEEYLLTQSFFEPYPHELMRLIEGQVKEKID
jgi:uncharacterized protein YbgA (DUF1722 family)/uncharacterized protein YbbK (DUF523 family)